MIVTPTFVSRAADATPPGRRPQDAGFPLGRDGEPVEDTARDAERVALEPDPNFGFEHWDEYWRKVHGPKFAYEEPGSTTEPVLRHHQVHRLPGGPSSYFRPPYLAMVDGAEKLVTDAYARVPGYRRPRWDGLAYIAYGSEDDMNGVLGQEKYQRVTADERVAFRMETRTITRERIPIASPTNRDPISLVKIHRRDPGLSRERFQEYWLDEHAGLVLSKTATHEYVRRYAQLHNIGSFGDDPEGSLIDGISVLCFSSVNDVEDYLTTEDHAAIEEDEASFAGGKGSKFWTAVNYTVVNRVFPELPTRR